jgi:signal transduction histidine kinase
MGKNILMIRNLRSRNSKVLFGLLIFFIIGLTPIKIYSQDQDVADSLILLYEAREYGTDTVQQEILSGIYKNHTVPDSVIKYAKIGYQLSIQTSNSKWKAKSLLNIGHGYKSKGFLEKSLEAYFSYLEIVTKEGDERRQSLAYSSIGSVYRVQENYLIALEYYNLSIEKLREIGDSTNLAISLLNTGELYRTNHKLDTAILYFGESGEIFDRINYKIGRAYNLGNIGLVLAEQGDNEVAEMNLLAATKILQELGDHYPIAVYNTSMAEIYKDKGDMPRALAYAHESYDLAVADGLKEQIRDASQELSELYEHSKNYTKAFEYQETYLAYRDSINNEETIRKMADLRTEYEVSQKQIEVDLLQQEQKTSQLIGASLLGIIVLISTFVFVLNRRNREKKRVNKLLHVQQLELKAQHDELETLNATKDRFFSIISHDLRGPVNAFKGLSSIIKHSVETKDYKAIPELSNMLDASAHQLSFLLDNLLEWAVNQQGEFPYKPEEVNLKKLVSKTIEVHTNMAQAKEIALKMNVDEQLHALVDYNSTRTILRNLVNNAIKFTKEGGLITIEGSVIKNNVQLEVVDNGVGIPAEKLEKLFILNETKSTPGTAKEKGLGLGIRLAYEFTLLNKGSMSVKSEEGKGTTFKISFPLIKMG